MPQIANIPHDAERALAPRLAGAVVCLRPALPGVSPLPRSRPLYGRRNSRSEAIAQKGLPDLRAMCLGPSPRDAATQNKSLPEDLA